MRKTLVALSFIVVLFVAPSLFAQATRTWVSGVGDDVNPCSRTAPCKTFAGAISKTAAGGEISVLDPGGYGAVTITKSITINGEGQIASALGSGGQSIIIVNGAGIIVNLVNLSINAGTPTSPAANGVRIINASHVSLANCDIFNYSQNGILDERTTAGKLTVMNTRIHNSLGTAVTRAGIKMQSSINTANVLHCDGCQIWGNQTDSSVGILVVSGAIASIVRSSIHSNVRGVSVAGGVVAIMDTVIRGNSHGLRAGGSSTTRIANTMITDNSANGIEFIGGVVESFGNNYIAGNVGNNGAGITNIGPQ